MNKIGKAVVHFSEELDFDTGTNNGGYCSGLKDSYLGMIQI